MIISEQDKLVMDNYDLVDHLISKYYPNYSDNDDVFSCASLGLVQASRNYKTSYKQPFRAYARYYIFHEIDKYLKQETSYHDYVSSLDDHDLVFINCEQKVFEKIISDMLTDMVPTLKSEERCTMELYYWDRIPLDYIAIYLKVGLTGIKCIYDRSIQKLRYRIRSCTLNGIL